MKKAIISCTFRTICIPNKSELVVILVVILSGLCSVQAIERTVGVLQNDPNAFDGYTLFTPMDSNSTFLVDNNGREINSWISNYWPSNTCYLLENGDLLRAAHLKTGEARGGGVQKFDWDGNLDWDFEYYSNDNYHQHHDIEPMPNGNVLILSRDFKTKAEAIIAGRNPALVEPTEMPRLWSKAIIEVEPNGLTGGNIVWEWYLWDHLIQDYDVSRDNYGVVEDHPELVDINFTEDASRDWIHGNSVDYHEKFDQILLSCRELNQFFVIDHSTTTAEAAGHTGGNSGKGGDILYRWGNPQSYRAGGPEDQQLFHQHDARWIEEGLPGEGNIMVFNNGIGRPGPDEYSSVLEIAPPVDANGIYSLTEGSAYEPNEPAWSYVAENPTDFFSSVLSGAHRLANGNTLICSGIGGLFFEVTPQGQIVWQYINSVTMLGIIAQGESIERQGNNVFRCHRYAPDYPGLSGRDLTPGCVIERYRSNVNDDCRVNLLDLGLWSSHWLENNCSSSNDCEGMDLDLSGIVDPNDLMIIGFEWLWDGSVPQI